MSQMLMSLGLSFLDVNCADNFHVSFLLFLCSHLVHFDTISKYFIPYSLLRPLNGSSCMPFLLTDTPCLLVSTATARQMVSFLLSQITSSHQISLTIGKVSMNQPCIFLAFLVPCSLASKRQYC